MISRKEWVSQFEECDRADAISLLDKIHTVSLNEFAKVIDRLIVKECSRHDEPVALFIEREVRKVRGGKPARLFKQQKVKVGKRWSLRATGGAPPVFYSQRGDRHEVGSEGLAASLSSQLGRIPSLSLFPNPSPGLFRKKKIRHFFLITDIIGSGDRAWSYLESAWLVKSVKSWHSRKLLKFTVLAYAGTDVGVRRVKQHPCKPNVIIARECPTIFTEFPSPSPIVELCEKYYKGKKDVLGYGKTGALIVFRHGCPNNAPPILHEVHPKWKALFAGRSGSFGFDAISPPFTGLDFGTYLTSLGYPDLAKKPVFLQLGEFGKKMVLLMCALKKGLAKIEVLCSGTGLLLSELEDIKVLGIKQGLLTENLRLTDLGMGTLHALLKVEKSQVLPKVSKTYYYPKQLRQPV